MFIDLGAIFEAKNVRGVKKSFRNVEKGVKDFLFQYRNTFFGPPCTNLNFKVSLTNSYSISQFLSRVHIVQ